MTVGEWHKEAWDRLESLHKSKEHLSKVKNVEIQNAIQSIDKEIVFIEMAIRFLQQLGGGL